MTILDRAAGALRPPPSDDVRPATPTAAALAAAQAAVASLVVVLVPVVGTWLAATADRAPWTSVLRLGSTLWLLGHHVPVAVPGGEVSFTPLGLLALVASTVVGSAHRMARVLDPEGDRIEAGTSSAEPVPPGWGACLLFVAVYAALAALLAAAAGTPAARPDPARAAVAAAVLAAAGCALGVASYLAGRLRDVPAFLADLLPGPVRAVVAPAGAALAVQVGAGGLLVAVMLGVEHGGVTSLYGVLDAGVVGGVVLTVGQLAIVPNLAVWGAAFLAGPGFSVGRGTSVTPAAAAIGDLPTLPVLGALPTPGPMPGAVLACLLVPLAAGAVAGWLVVRSRGADAGRWGAVGDTVLVGLLTGAGGGVLAWLSGGGIGPGRLAATGPDPLATAAVLAAEVTVGALLLVGVRAALPGSAGRADAG